MATILDGLNAISQAVGGTGEAESNLEALNQISEALGGSADATENAEAIANIAENASGGGGELSNVRVTIKNSTSSVATFTYIEYDNGSSLPSPAGRVNSGATNTIDVQANSAIFPQNIGASVSWRVLSGDAVWNGIYAYVKSGDCSLEVYNT